MLIYALKRGRNMDKIYFTKQEFEKIWNNLAFLGRASEGTCKRLNNKEVIKYLDGPYVNLNEEQILMFKDIKNKTITKES